MFEHLTDWLLDIAVRSCVRAACTFLLRALVLLFLHAARPACSTQFLVDHHIQQLVQSTLSFQFAFRTCRSTQLLQPTCVHHMDVIDALECNSTAPCEVTSDFRRTDHKRT